MAKMLPEHEQFLIAHMERMGFMFIIDFLKRDFPALSHVDACAIYDEFKAKHADDAKVKSAAAQLKEAGKKIGHQIGQALDKALRKDGK